MPVDSLQLFREQTELGNNNHTFGEYSARPRKGLAISQLRGGRNLLRKPVIYLSPPAHLPNVTVSDGRQSVTWSVSASPDGTLVEHRTNLELCYLFWEALSNPTAPLASQTTWQSVHDSETAACGNSNFLAEEYFDPVSPYLEPDSLTAVLLPARQLLHYLDGALKALSLHTAARNDFITYWLPALPKHKLVALRFMPQAVYERAAELEVAPAPDVVTRVMMLFRGVASDEVDKWAAARERVGMVDWANVVGVMAGAHEKGLFRVLEWGAIEVFETSHAET